MNFGLYSQVLGSMRIPSCLCLSAFCLNVACTVLISLHVSYACFTTTPAVTLLRLAVLWRVYS